MSGGPDKMNWWVRIDWTIVGYTDRERPPSDFVFRGNTILCSRQAPANIEAMPKMFPPKGN